MKDCSKCVHKPVCDLWRSKECQDAKSFSSTEDECVFFLEERRWIPVTERLPKAWEEVLTHRTGGNLSIEFKCSGDEWSFDNDIMEEVTHWMPLPEPPKE